MVWFREGVASGGFAGERDNCELSDRDSRELEMGNAQFFDTAGNYDFYERALGRLEDDCLDGNKCRKQLSGLF